MVNYTMSSKTVGRVTADVVAASWNVDAEGGVRDQAFTDGAAFTIS